MDNLKGYKTIIFNVLMTAFMGLKLWKPEAGVLDGPEITAGLDLVEGAILFIWGVGAIFLRAITNSPIFSKE